MFEPVIYFSLHLHLYLCYSALHVGIEGQEATSRDNPWPLFTPKVICTFSKFFNQVLFLIFTQVDFSNGNFHFLGLFFIVNNFYLGIDFQYFTHH